MKLRHFILASIFTIGASLGNAQAPQEFNYQAVVRDGSGNVLPSQAVGLEISIRQTTPGGTIVYTETHSTSTSNIGLVNVPIGGGTPTSGTFAAIDWAAGPYFVEIGLDPTGGTSYTSMGTQQLLSVPYALYAAGGNWTQNGSDIHNSNTGNVGVGIVSPPYTFSVHNDGNPTIALGRNSFNQDSSGIIAFDEDVTDSDICGFAFNHNGSANTLDLITGCPIPSAGDTAFRITRGNGYTHFKERVRIGNITTNPTSDLDIEQSDSPWPDPTTGGITLKSNTNTNEWQIWYSNPYCSFAYNNTRVAYVDNGTGAWVTTSDRRYKRDIEPMENVLDKVLMLEPVKYLYNHNEAGATKQRGFIAQDIQQIFPDLVHTEDGTQLALDRADFGVLAIKAIQEQQVIIDQQNEIIQDLINRIKKLEGK